MFQQFYDDDQLKFTEYFGELEEFPEADKTKESNKTYHVANVTVEGKHLTEEDDQVIFLFSFCYINHKGLQCILYVSPTPPTKVKVFLGENSQRGEGGIPSGTF